MCSYLSLLVYCAILHRDISLKGGSILGSSREVPRAEALVDAILDHGFNQVYIIGGGPIDGTLKASQQLFEEVKRRQLKCAVAVIPKTIDNDIMRIQRSFGFETSIEAAAQALRSIHCEASCSYHAVVSYFYFSIEPLVKPIR